MADVIARFKGDTSDLDTKIKKASQTLLQMKADCDKVGGAFINLDKEQVQFIRDIGRMETGCKDARSTVATLTKSFTDLSAMYNRLSEEEKKDEGGKALRASLDMLKTRIIDAKNELKGIDKELGNIGSGGFDLKGMAGGAMKFAGSLGIAVSAVGLFKDALKNNVETAMRFEKSMSNLSSLTGMVGEDLETLKRKAIELGSTTTQSASQAAEAMAIIGSKRPDLLESAYALSDVTKAAITMSEAAGMDVPTAADALAAALNIFQMESDQATRVINVLAAGSKLGAAGIQELGDITFRAGGMAKKAGMSFEEFAGAAEILRPAFGTAEDAGQAFNKFLQMLESKMDSQYKPSVVGFEQAMKNLKEANLGSNESLKIFTINGVKAYDAIMANVDGLGKMIKGVTGTNTATEQAATNTNNLSGSMASLSSAWEGFNLALNDSNGALKTMVDWLTDCVTWATNTFTELGRIKSKMDEINGVKGDGPTRNDNNMQYVKNAGSRGGAETRRKMIVGRYNNLINEKSGAIYRAEQSLANMTDNAQIRGQKLIIQSLKEERQALRGVRDEFDARAKEYIKNFGKKEIVTPTGTGGGGGKTTQLKVEKPKVIETSSMTELQILQDQLETVKNSMKGYGEASEEWKLMNEEAKDLTAQIDALNGKTQEFAAGISGINADAFSAYKKMLQESMKGVDLTDPLYQNLQQNLADTTTLQNILQEALRAGIDMATIDAEGLWDKILGGGNIPDDVWQSLADEINAKLAELGIEPIKINFETGNIEKVTKGAKESEKSFSAAANAISQVGGALQNIQDPTAKVLGTVAQAIASVTLAAGQAMAAKDTTSSGWAWIGAAASITATMISTIAAIKSATAEYHAEGGIVGQGPFIPRGTDTVPAMLTPQEVVLNAGQAQNVAAQLQGGGIGNMHLETVLHGEDMRIMLVNNDRRRGRGRLTIR